MTRTPGYRRIGRLAIALALALTAVATTASPSVRIKDLTDVEGVRSNALVGYGLVVGLQGTGDGMQAEFTTQSLVNLLRRSGVTVPGDAVRVRNVAAVMVTAELPAFTRPGQTIDVLVSSIGDAKSLLGGTLLMTPLEGPDGGIYAVAQGAISLGGAFQGGGGGNSVQKNHPTAGRIAGGATVERAVPFDLSLFDSFRMLLRQPDFATATHIADAVNAHFGQAVAVAEDPGGVRIMPPESHRGSPVRLIAEVEALLVRPELEARVAINEKTGTVVMGADVRISKVALAHSNLTIEVATDFEASQPAPFSETAETVVLPQREVLALEGPNQVLTLDEGISVGELVDALNVLGVSAREMIAIFEAMRAAGALHAELVVL